MSIAPPVSAGPTLTIGALLTVARRDADAAAWCLARLPTAPPQSRCTPCMAARTGYQSRMREQSPRKDPRKRNTFFGKKRFPKWKEPHGKPPETISHPTNNERKHTMKRSPILAALLVTVRLWKNRIAGAWFSVPAENPLMPPFRDV
jgi:hypothetical protein